MLEHAVNAITRVLGVIKGVNPSSVNSTLYELFGVFGEMVAVQVLKVSPRLAASFLHGPTFAGKYLFLRPARELTS